MRSVWRVGVPYLALTLAACGNDAGVVPIDSPPDAAPVVVPDAAAVIDAPPPPPASRWTTLGNRTSPAVGDIPITTNAAGKWTDYNPPVTYPKVASANVQYIVMPDGVQLATYVTLPAGDDGTATTDKLPTILVQTAYNGGDSLPILGNGTDPYLVQHGYAMVVVDVRGTGQSTGQWDSFGDNEQADYGRVVDWVTQQSFSNGKIGVAGVSYLGITAIITAAQQHPAVKAAFPVVPVGDAYRDMVFTGGQANPTFLPFWLGLVSVTSLLDPTVLTNPQVGLVAVTDHIENAIANFQVPTLLQAVLGTQDRAYDGDFFATRSPLERDGKITVPTFVVGGLHDIFQRSEPITYETIKNHTTTKLLIGPWTHLGAAQGTGLPADGVPVLDHIELQWFDQYVKGMDVGADKLPNVTQYVSGLEHYVTATDWPNQDARATRLYFHGDGSLDGDDPAMDEAPQTVAQVPIEGICSISMSQWTAGVLGLIPLPCFSNDNLTESWAVNFQTKPLDDDYYINGPIEADVWMTTSAGDAGLSVRVDDVDEMGTAHALTNGLQTASLRAVDPTKSRTLDGQSIQPWHVFTIDSVQPLTPGAPPGVLVMVPVEVFPTSAKIAKGHRLRVSVGASDLPQGVPPVPTALTSSLGVLTVASDADHPSSVVLPLVPASALQQ
jgi:putative CocE/NonD family hydrolase